MLPCAAPRNEWRRMKPLQGHVADLEKHGRSRLEPHVFVSPTCHREEAYAETAPGYTYLAP